MDTPTSAVWRRLRATRWQAPGRGARQRTYQAALGQAEELFRAAAVVSPASRPLPLFYGLSQAGRAIAAASPGGPWELQGHGLTCSGYDRPLPELLVRPQGKDTSSFKRLSVLLGSPLWEEQEVRLETLWDCLPTNERMPLSDATTSRHTPLHVWNLDLLTASEVPATLPVGDFPPHLVQAQDPQALREYLEAFPQMRGTSFAQGNTDPVLIRHVDGWGSMEVFCRELAAQSVEEQLAFLHGLTHPYLGDRVFFPAPHPGAERGMHPLMAWWAVLFALSMLARYQPSEWARCIDVDSSQYAVPIEHALATALEKVPRLVLEALGQVTGTPVDGGL